LARGWRLTGALTRRFERDAVVISTIMPYAGVWSGFKEKTLVVLILV
jgi:hypothetical protein